MRPLFLLLASFAALITNAQTDLRQEVRFLSQPTLTPDGQTVIFSYEGDLWKASVKDGLASRLTAMQGYETNPSVSPDGRWIAFSGSQYGNTDVYVIPVSGGDVKQLTWNSAADEVSSWSWDSKWIYFSSTRSGQQSAYKVPLAGGTATRVFGDNYFLYDHNVMEHPLTGELFFNDTWESSNQLQRKHYKGPFNPDIQSYNPVTKAYKRYTDWIGKDFGATIDRKGHIYFLSDEADGEYNLYTFDHEKKTPLTHFKTSTYRAQVCADGGKVVFEKDFQLWLYDVASAKADRLPVSILRNNLLPRERDYEVKGNITAFDVSPDGKKIALVSRGEMFVSDAEGKFIREIPRNTSERVKEVKWLADSRNLLYTQTVGGYTNVFTVAADGNGTARQLTQGAKNDRSLVLNKKRTMAVYLSGRDEVRLLDLKSFQGKQLAKDEIWGFQSSDPGFSPNDEYVVFTAHRHFEQDVFIHNLKSGKTINLTNTAVTESDPLWSPDGKSIFFLSSRTKPSYPLGLQDPHVYRMPLDKTDEPFRTDRFLDLFHEEKKDTSRKKDTVAQIHIDLADNMERLQQVGPLFGTQRLLHVTQKGDKTIVLLASNHLDGRFAVYKTVLEPFESPRTERIAGADGVGDFAESGNQLFALLGGTLYKVNLDQNKVDPVAVSFTFRRNLSAEFGQMFTEAWAQMQENYYDEHFHGVDWPRTRDHYAQFLPYINNRGDLRVMLNQMLGELNSSHQGFNTTGDDETLPSRNVTMQSGILFENNHPYRVSRILPRSAADKLGVDVQPGDELVSVDGVKTDPAFDRDYYFTHPSAGRELAMTFRRGDREISVKVHPQTTIGNALYDDWIANNQRRVDEKSGKRIAYSCMKDMGQPELEHFLLDMTKQLADRDALILDIRYNRGGNVHDPVLDFLSRKAYLQWKYREGQLTPQPNFAPGDKPIILLTNEQSLSDAEMTAQGFKALKLGRIVGNETYHWIIFTSAVGLVDGSSVRMPAWGCYTLEGKDLEANGVQPDIRVVNTFEDRVNDRDPQLDRAIAEIMKEIRK